MISFDLSVKALVGARDDGLDDLSLDPELERKRPILGVLTVRLRVTKEGGSEKKGMTSHP